MPLFLSKEFGRILDDFSGAVDQAVATTAEETAANALVKAAQLPSPQLTAISTKITVLLSRLESINSAIKGVSHKSEVRSLEGPLEVAGDPKVQLGEKKSVESKPAKKKLIKAVVMTHMEVKKCFLSSALEVVNSVHFKLDHIAYRSLAINSFDFLPYISQRLTSSISTYKDVNLELLGLCWKLMSFPKSNITFSENQRLVGVPEVLPFRYGNEGVLLKNAGKIASKKTPQLRKGVFNFHEDSVHVEVVRLVRKIHTTSTKQLQVLAAAPPKEPGAEESGQVNVKELYKECKNTLNTKLHMYKISFVSFLMLLHLENPKFEMQMLRAREVKSDYFDRSLQQTHIKHWEARVLSSI